MNSFGRIFRVSIYGESHGNGLGVVIDGALPGVKVDLDEMIEELKRRKSGGVGTTKRIEPDTPKIVSGVFNDYTTGSPIHIMFENTNTISKDYNKLKDVYRPSHADFVANYKYQGYQDYRGGGHFSGRITAGLVAAGFLAKKMLPFNISAKLVQVKDHIVTTEEELDKYLETVVEQGDSVGGIIKITVKNMDVGLGEPFFDSVESVLSKLIFSVPAVKGVYFGIGFEGINKFGSEFNDMIIDKTGKTSTNNSGGINGGISNGNDIEITCMVRPASSIYKGQNTYNFKTNKVEELIVEGRHDACIPRRAVVVLESVVAIGLLDLYLVNKSKKKD